MNYIFIDESGSLSSKLKHSFFSISMLIINNEKISKTKNIYKREIIKFKKNYNIAKNIELKGHYLKQNNLLFFLNLIVKKCIYNLNNTFMCAYIDLKNINQKWLNDKGATYNFMVKIAIIEALKLKLIASNDIIIVSDTFSMQYKFFGSIEQYLKAELILHKHYFDNIIHKYNDSKHHWGLQLADYISFKNNQYLNHIDNEWIKFWKKDWFKKIY